MRSQQIDVKILCTSVMRLLLLALTVQLGKAQTTNTIPPNLYLTDDGKVFSFKSGQRMIRVRSIEEAKRLKESQSAEQDPDGHWGEITNGLQLSLRFEKGEYQVGEPLTAVVLLRN